MTPKELALSFFPDDPVMRGKLISAIIESIAAEREACAKIAESARMIHGLNNGEIAYSRQTARDIAVAIRERSNKEK